VDSRPRQLDVQHPNSKHFLQLASCVCLTRSNVRNHDHFTRRRSRGQRINGSCEKKGALVIYYWARAFQAAAKYAGLKSIASRSLMLRHGQDLGKGGFGFYIAQNVLFVYPVCKSPA
jgi:hypothetical protein